MTLNPWAAMNKTRQQIIDQTSYIAHLRLRIQADVASYLVLQRELSHTHAALRRKNLQLKHLRATLELHKEYTKLHAPQPTR